MGWPTPAEINEAVQNPQLSFHDQDLAASEVENDQNGIPLARSGSNADVYSFTHGAERIAVKCFTRPIAHLERRYREVHNVLNRLKLSFTVDCAYQSQGIWLRDQWYPIVRMKWVDGVPLNEFARHMIGSKNMLQKLIQALARMGDLLAERNLGHCDLQHGNILLTESDDGSKLAIRLVDYDGMWMPTLANDPPQEFGHPDYQHPERLLRGYYGPAADRFSLLAIATGLQAVVAHGEELWNRYDNSVNVLFQQKDYADPHRSPLLQELSRSKDSTLLRLCEALTDACRGPLERVRPLSEILSGNVAISTSPGRSAEPEGKNGRIAEEMPPRTKNNEPTASPVRESRIQPNKHPETTEGVKPKKKKKETNKKPVANDPEELWKKWGGVVICATSIFLIVIVLWIAGAFRGKTPTRGMTAQAVPDPKRDSATETHSPGPPVSLEMIEKKKEEKNTVEADGGLKDKEPMEENADALSELMAADKVLLGNLRYTHGRVLDIKIVIKDRDGKKFAATYTWKEKSGRGTGTVNIEGDIDGNNVRFNTVRAVKYEAKGHLDVRDKILNCTFYFPDSNESGTIVFKFPDK